MAAFLAAPGCAVTQVGFTTTRQMGSGPDIYTNQVLENLARAAVDQTALPYFALLQNGVPSTSDTGSLTIGPLSFPGQTAVNQLHNQRSGTLGPLGASRVVGANWTISPVNDPDRLTAMRHLYLWVLGRPPENLEKANALLQHYIGKDFSLTDVPQDWFRHGKRHDVPKEACRRFHHHGTSYWIVPGMEEQLTSLTIKMLDIATVTPTTSTQTVVWTIDPNTNLPTAVNVTRTVNIVADTPTPIPLRPIILTVGVRPPSQSHLSYVDPDQKGQHEIKFPDDIGLPGRYNNYVSPLISPGLFSQPRP